MSGPSIFFEDVNERQGGFLRRTFLLGGFTALGLTALSGRLAFLQVFQTARYRSMSVENQFNLRLIPPPRGRVLDRNGIVLAGNRPSFRLLVIRDETKDLDTTLDAVEQLIPSTSARRRTLLREINQSPRFVPVAVASDLTWDEFARVNLHATQLPGVMADMHEARFYPFGGAFAHVIGYVAKVSDRDIKRIKDKGEEPDPILLHPGYRIGKQGIERSLDEQLRGEPGVTRVEVDASGRQVGEDAENTKAPVPGSDVVLTLDADVQNRALEVFGEESGAAVVMDVRNGDILCMMSAPAFDANLFVGGVPSKTYKLLSEYERKPLLDKALSGLFPPGSTFKMTTALALLAAGIKPSERVGCSGGYRFGARTFRCWKAGGHGSMDMHNAIKNSCDTYFYAMSNRAGVDRIAEAARALGFQQKFSERDFGNQKKGLVPDTAWKRTTRDPTWHPGETLSVAIGQGALQVNALQLAVMTARLANGKKAVQPRLVKSIGETQEPSGAAVPDLPFSEEHLEIVRAGMAAVANDVSGTAYRASRLGLGDILMAGKTGTAQVRDYKEGQSRKAAEWRNKDHGLFVAFAPHDNPRYAISIIVEHGVGGALAAAPRAREIMRVALLKDPDMRARIERPLPQDGLPDNAAPTGGEPDVYQSAPTGPAPATEEAARTAGAPQAPAAPGPAEE